MSEEQEVVTEEPAPPVNIFSPPPDPPSMSEKAAEAVAIVERWFGVKFPGTIFSGTDHWNFMVAAVDELKTQLSSI